MRAGDEKEVSMDFPDDFEIETLAGKKAFYTLEAHEVREQVLPELDEAFLKNFEVDSMEEFKEGVHRDLQSRKEEQLHGLQRRQVADTLAERIEFALPASAMETESSRIMEDLIQHNLNRGVVHEQLEEHKKEIYDSAR